MNTTNTTATTANECNATMDDRTTLATWAKYDPAKLPVIKFFKIDSRGGIGGKKNFHERKCGAFALLVSCADGRGLHLASDTLARHGMRTKCEFATFTDALEAGRKMQATWGFAKAPKAKGAKKAELTAENEKLRAALLAAGYTQEKLAELCK